MGRSYSSVVVGWFWEGGEEFRLAVKRTADEQRFFAHDEAVDKGDAAGNILSREYAADLASAGVAGEFVGFAGFNHFFSFHRRK